jgi:hypothetical protein
MRGVEEQQPAQIGKALIDGPAKTVLQRRFDASSETVAPQRLRKLFVESSIEIPPRVLTVCIDDEPERARERQRGGSDVSLNLHVYVCGSGRFVLARSTLSRAALLLSKTGTVTVK